MAGVTPPRILTSVTATVPTDRETEFLSAYRDMNATGYTPDGLLRSELLRGKNGRWVGVRMSRSRRRRAEAPRRHTRR